MPTIRWLTFADGTQVKLEEELELPFHPYRAEFHPDGLQVYDRTESQRAVVRPKVSYPPEAFFAACALQTRWRKIEALGLKAYWELYRKVKALDDLAARYGATLELVWLCFLDLEDIRREQDAAQDQDHP